MSDASNLEVLVSGVAAGAVWAWGRWMWAQRPLVVNVGGVWRAARSNGHTHRNRNNQV